MISIDTKSLIKNMGGKTYAVTRSSGGQYVEGKFVNQGETVVNITASVQPLTGLETQSIPEGDRNKERLKIYSVDLIQMIEESTGREADIINVDGVEFLVENVEKWPNYYKGIIVKVNPEDEEG